MATHRLYTLIVVLIIFFPQRVFSYEKTLRKIVRNQSKMVQRPFSDSGSQNWQRNNQSLQGQISGPVFAPGFTQTKMLHRAQRPKMSTIISSVQPRAKSAHSKPNFNNDIDSNEMRLTRNTLQNSRQVLLGKEYYVDKQQQNKSPISNVAIENYYQIPSRSKYFPPVEEEESLSLEDKVKDTIIFPENEDRKDDDDSRHLKSVFTDIKNISDITDDQQQPKLHAEVKNSDSENAKADFFLNGNPVDAEATYSYYNASKESYLCEALKEADADIDAQKKFSEFDIEPPWAVRKRFWDRIFESRYESLLRNSKWPPLKVILVPRTHIDTIWKRTFVHNHNDSVSKILANIVKKLQFYPNLTFAWNEVSHLSRWWKNTSHKSRKAFKRLLQSGRLEITTGGWVEPDEATTHIFGLVHQLIQGQEWLKYHLNYSPNTAWLTNTVTHSSTMTYLLSTLDISQLVMTNLHFSWEQYLAEYQYSDFIWLQHWDVDKSSSTFLNQALGNLGCDRHPKHSVMTHYLQFNSAGFNACGPNGALCSSDFNFAKSFKNLDITPDNIKKSSESLLDQYSKSGTITPHNTIIAPIGVPYYSYESQLEFDFQYNNYQKIANFVNDNRGIYKATFEFGTPKDYFNTIYTKYKRYPTLKGDFLNFADISSGKPAYWTGFFTSRPYLKILLRRLESTMKATEILVSFALTLHSFREYNVTHIFEKLVKCRESLARLMDRNVVSGTLPAHILTYANKIIMSTIKDCWYIQETAASLLTSKKRLDKSYLQKYVYRNGELISTLKTVSPNDHLYIFNSLSHETTEIIELVTKTPNIRILDYKKKEVTIQINPIWKYSNDNIIRISRRYFKITFAVMMPPMTLELYKIRATYDATLSIATIYCSSCALGASPSDSKFPFHIQPIRTGGIQLESYKHRLIFDEVTGFLKTIVDKETNTAKTVVIDFGAFRDTDVNSGMFLFNTNVSKPIDDILMPYRIRSKTKVTIIVSGQLTTEISTIFGRLLQHTIRIFNLIKSPLSNAIHIQTKVDYEISPKNRDLELFMSIQTEITNGNPPQIYLDINGFQHTARVINISRRIESNMYPITSMAYIQDHKSRFTYITDHAQGVTALQEGQLVVMLDRRVLSNDGRGVDEDLADSIATTHRQFILLENFRDYVSNEPRSTSYDLSLPSLTAIHLANSLDNLQDIFIAHRNSTDFCYYGILPLINKTFPCDVSIINFRVVLAANWNKRPIPGAALMILHNRSFSCTVNSTLAQRNGEFEFCLDKIVRNVKAVYQTNLAGTNKGIHLLNYCLVNLSPMELITLRLYF